MDWLLYWQRPYTSNCGLGYRKNWRAYFYLPGSSTYTGTVDDVLLVTTSRRPWPGRWYKRVASTISKPVSTFHAMPCQRTSEKKQLSVCCYCWTRNKHLNWLNILLQHKFFAHTFYCAEPNVLNKVGKRDYRTTATLSLTSGNICAAIASATIVVPTSLSSHIVETLLTTRSTS